MISHKDSAAVEQAIRTVAAEEVVARFRHLAAEDVIEKNGPYDLVTVADRRAEERLTEELTALLPGSLVVGEEAVHAAPELLERLRGDAPVWIIDPVDGTANFVRGDPHFAMLVALAQGGEVQASWTYAPVSGLMATARRGNGAFVDGERATTRAAGGQGPLKVAVSQFTHRSEDEQRRLRGLVRAGVETRTCTSAGLDYVELARGGLDGVVYMWEAPWDHAAGLLLVTEAGGTSLTAGGEPFRVTGRNILPFTAARDAETARRLMSSLG